MVEGYEEDVLMSMQSFDEKEIMELESEIRYLRQLLDSNGIAYDYQAYKESLASTEEGGIEFPELTREHAQNLYDALQGAADHVFLLQGGNSLKARAALRDKMLAVGRDETMIVVAIGQYIGEGFNYPRLDTLLLAMPISFEGNVEQYTVRILCRNKRPSL